MSNQTESDLLQRAHDLCEYVRGGRILEALQEFYDENCVMQENLNPPTVGLIANVEREQAWLGTVAEWKGFEVRSVAASGDTTFTETTMDYVGKDGGAVHIEQVARAVWKNGRIVDERFYHG